MNLKHFWPTRNKFTTAASKAKINLIELKFGYFCALKNSGEVSEWPIEHAWKACLQQCNEGSNPSLSAFSSEALA